MASGPTLPPQAYTRETLTAAFNWLQTQPDSVRKLATTPDALVGLYVRAQRFGASSLEADAPVSSQNFMSDLKNLAEGLKQFEDPKERIRAAQSAQGAMQAPSINGNGSSSANGSASHTPSNSPSLSAPTSSTSMSLHHTIPHHPPQQSVQHSSHSSPALPQPTPSQPQAFFQSPPIASSYTHSPQLTSGSYANPLNERSWQLIQEVKVRLNLSSDSEAANMMVALAYKSLKNLLA
jgi:hypothetical protein